MECPKHPGDLFDPDKNFCDKVQYLRRNGLNITYSQGQQNFHDKPSVYQQEKDVVADLRANNVEFDRKR